MMDRTRRSQNSQKDKLSKWQTEVTIWKKILIVRREENLLLKDRFTDILKNNYNKDCLEEIEDFQNKFIMEDEFGDILRKEVAALGDLLNSAIVKSEGVPGWLEDSIKKLRNDITFSETRFEFVTSSFIDFEQSIYSKKGGVR